MSGPADRGPRVVMVVPAFPKLSETFIVSKFLGLLDRGYDVLVEMDADGSHQPEELPRLLAATTWADVVLGSRWVPGGVVRNWPLSRRLLSRGGTAYARLALALPVEDATSGYRAIRAGALRALDLGTVASQGYCFQIDMAWRASRATRRSRAYPR